MSKWPSSTPGAISSQGKSLKSLVIQYIRECFNGLYDVECKDGHIKFFNFDGELVDDCPVGGMNEEQVCQLILHKLPTAKQELFFRGDVIPSDIAVSVCLTDNSIVLVNPNEALPENINGAVIVDEKTKKAQFIQNPSKPEDKKQLIYKAGDGIPLDVVNNVIVCLNDNTTIELMAGAVIPPNANGHIIVDPVTNRSEFVQKPDKSEHYKPVQTHFCAGEKLPDDISESVQVHTDGGVVTVEAGESLPLNLNGVVTVDAVTRKPFNSTHPDETTPNSKELFKAGSTLPNGAETVSVCLVDDSIIDVKAGEKVPVNIDGYVHFDETTGETAFVQRGSKPVPPRQLVYGAGEKLPSDMLKTVKACLLGGEVVTLVAEDDVPVEIDGSIIIDPVTRCASYTQTPVKIPITIKAGNSLFGLGETLPKDMNCPAEVCLMSGVLVDVLPGQKVPDEADGSIYVDPCSRKPKFIQSPKKLLKSVYKPGENLPVINGVVAVCLSDNTIVDVNGGEDVPTAAQGNIVVDAFGNATFSQYPVKLVEEEIEQELFKAGDALPEEMLGTVEVCLDDNTTVVIGAGDDVPGNALGAVIVDEKTRRAEFTQKPVKKAPELVSIFVEHGDQVAGESAGSGTQADPLKVVLPKTEVKELFCAGEALPARMVGSVDIGLPDSIGAGETIPGGVGCIFVDAVDGEAVCVPNKSTPTILAQELFKPGQSLPDDMLGAIEVCLESGDIVSLEAGQLIPIDALGSVVVDEKTHQAAWTQKPVKPTPKTYHRYVAFDPLIHTGEEVGMGTLEDPIQIPVTPYYVAPQELFCAGDVLPSDMSQSVLVILDDGSEVFLQPGAQISGEIDGCVIVDELTKEPAFTQYPVEKLPVFKCELPDGSFADLVVEDGVLTVPYKRTYDHGDQLPNPETTSLEQYFEESTGCIFYNINGVWIAPKNKAA